MKKPLGESDGHARDDDGVEPYRGENDAHECANDVPLVLGLRYGNGYVQARDSGDGVLSGANLHEHEDVSDDVHCRRAYDDAYGDVRHHVSDGENGHGGECDHERLQF